MVGGKSSKGEVDREANGGVVREVRASRAER